MKHLKMLGLAAVAATALMALVGAATASAETTELFSEGSTVNANTVIHASLEGGTSAVLTDTSEGLTDTCEESTVSGKTTNATGATVVGNIEALNWGKCTWPTSTIIKGSLTITRITGTNNGTVLGTGSEVTVKAFNLVDCFYGTETDTHLGVLDGAAAGHSKMTVSAVINEQTEKKVLCPDTTFWKATYLVTSPTGLSVGS